MRKVNQLLKIPKNTIDYEFGYRYADQITGRAFTVHPFGYQGKKIDRSEVKWKPTKPVKRKEYLEWKKEKKLQEKMVK
jgi:hypothetical protein